jgi:hypothetical protein
VLEAPQGIISANLLMQSRSSINGISHEVSVRVGLTSVLTGNEILLDLKVLMEINFFLLILGYYFNENEMSYLKAKD